MLTKREIVILPDGRMDTRNAAAYLGFSIKTLAMQRCAGTGPRFVKRGRVFYFRQDLDEWLLDGLVESTPQALMRRSSEDHGIEPLVHGTDKSS